MYVLVVLVVVVVVVVTVMWWCVRACARVCVFARARVQASLLTMLQVQPPHVRQSRPHQLRRDP